MSRKKSKIKETPAVSEQTSPAPAAATTAPVPWMRRFFWAVSAAAVLLAGWAMFLSADGVAEAQQLATAGWGEYGAVIVQNKVNALWHAAFMTALMAAFLWLCIWGQAGLRRWLPAAAAVLVAAVALDAIWLSRHYVKTLPLEALAENDVIRILRADQTDRRVALATQEGFYNFWLTYVFPYYNIPAVNVAQMPRMPISYKRFLERVGQNPLRFWQLMAVNFVVAPAQFWTQVNSDPYLKDAFELAYAFNVAPGPQGMGAAVIPATPDNPGQHAVIRFKAPAPRYALMAGWRKADDEEALRLLSSTNFALFSEALIAPECAADLPVPAGSGTTGLVQRVEYRTGFMRLNVSAPTTCLLRVSEKYDPYWKATVDDNPTPVRRVDYLFQGVLVGPGLHEVVLRYAPPWWSLVVQIFGMSIAAVAAWRFLSAGQGRAL